MKFAAIAASLLASASVVLGNAASLETQISTISNYTLQLQADLNRYNGGEYGLPYALQAQLDSVNIYRQLKNGTTLANAQTQFNNSDSTTVSVALAQLVNTAKSVLNTTANKASTFGELSPIVLASLYQLKNESDVFAAAAAATLSSSLQSIAPSVIGQLDDAYDSAIEAYGGVAPSKK